MKFATLAALVATAQAAVGQDCSADGVCEETECCGTGTPDMENGVFEAEEPASVTVCQTDTEAEYVNAENEDEIYTFECNPEGTVYGEGEGSGDAAVKLAASAAIAAALLLQ